MLGYPDLEMIGKNVSEISIADEFETESDQIQKFQDQELDSLSFEKRYRTKAGAIVWTNVFMSLIDYPNIPQRLIITIVENISARKLIEEDKRKMEIQLAQAQKMETIGQLAGGVAHDFNNILGVILGHTDLAMSQVNSSHPIYTDLEEIRKATDRSANLTRQLLAFARKQPIMPKVLDLNMVVESVLKMLRRLIGEGIELIWRPGANLWPIKVDPSQIDQILVNLCVNARDAILGGNGIGKITIETTTVVFYEAYCIGHAGVISGDFVMLAVSDDGCGMGKDTLGKLFEPFFTTKGPGKGTGLGLATIDGIVKQNNGFINVCSKPGQGTTFKIYIPKHTGQTLKDTLRIGMNPLMRGEETILLVEDETTILKICKAMLEKLGYRVLATDMPSDAIRLATEHPGNIHLLITDIVMPEMNGVALAKLLQGKRPSMKCMFMSGYTANIIASRGLLEEGLQFLQKPFSLNVLAAKVREALDIPSVK